jgi:hypothetical protein
MARRYNEGKAIDAVLRRIEARDHALRLSGGRSPDDLNDPDPLRRVDYVCTVGNALYAFEHTGIEPFGNQIELEVHNRKLFEPICERFDYRADRELWELHVPVEASAGLRGAQIDRVRDLLIRWIETNASHLPVTLLYDRYATPWLGRRLPGFRSRFLCIAAHLTAIIFRVKALYAAGSCSNPSWPAIWKKRG